MNKYFFIFLIFSFLSLAAVGASVYESPFFSPDKTNAEGFGISPPYFKNDNLRPGETYSATISILRSEAKTKASAEVKIDASAISGWFKIEQGNLINLDEGDLNIQVNISVTVPPNAKSGNYKGVIYFLLLTDQNYSGVGIRVGAMAEINLQVVGEDDNKQTEGDFNIDDYRLYKIYKGLIIKTASSTRAYYISPMINRAFLAESPDNIVKIIKEQGRGITNKDLGKIPLVLNYLSGVDSDSDGLIDNLEIALGTDEKLKDTDGDLFSDYDEINNGYSPTKKYEALPIDLGFARAQAGRIFLQVEGRGEAWYINPADNKRYFLATPAEAYNIINALAIGMVEKDFNSLVGL